jgi:hypothetical protein
VRLRTGRLLTVAASLLAATLVMACTPGMSRDRAMERALSEAGPGARSAISAESGPLGTFVDQVPSGESRDHLVWAVLVSGTFEGECVYDPTNGGSVCPPPTSELLVVLDYATGQFILSRTGP